MRDILFTIFFFALLLPMISRPWLGIMVWSWLSYMNPHRLCYGFAAVLPVVVIAAGVTVFAWLMDKEPKRFPWTRETIIQCLFCFWMVVTSCFALGPFAWPNLDRALKVQAMILMTLLIVKSRQHLDALVWTIVISLGFYGVKGGIWSILTGGHNMVWGPPASFIAGNNEIALALVMVLPLMRYLQLHTENKWLRRGLAGAQLLTSVAVVGTYSRAGFLALCVVWFVQWFKSRHKLVLALALLLMAPPVLLFMPQEWKDRMHTLQNTDESTLDTSALGRINAWRFAWNLAVDNPITGGGFECFTQHLFFIYAPDPFDWHDAHSIYFQVLAEQGFPGLAMFLSLGLLTWLKGRSVIKKTRAAPELFWARDMVVAMQTGLVGFAVGGAFAGLAYFDLPYHMMAIIVLCDGLVNERLRSAAVEEEEPELVWDAMVESEA